MHLNVLVADGSSLQYAQALLLQEFREGVPQKSVLFLLRESAAPDTSFLPIEVDTDGKMRFGGY